MVSESRDQTPSVLISTGLILMGMVLLGVQFRYPDIIPSVGIRDYGDLGIGKHLLFFLPGTLALAAGLSPWIPRRWLTWILNPITDSSSRSFMTGIFGAALCAGVGMSLGVLAGIPHIQDSIAQLFQGRVLASGQLWTHFPHPDLSEFFACEFINVRGDSVYGKYNPGFSALLVPFIWLRVPWLLNPLLGALGIVMIYRIARWEYSENLARGAALLGLVSPFYWGLAGSFMNHTSALLANTLMILGWVRAQKSRHWGWAILMGSASGYIIITRQLTALGLTLPILIIMSCDGFRNKIQWRNLIIAGVCMALFMGGLAGYNAMVNGDPMRSGYTVYDPQDTIGFGPDIGLKTFKGGARPGHSVVTGISNIFLKLGVVGEHLFGWPSVCLIFLIPVIFRKGSRLEGVLLIQPVIVLGLYICFWHDGICFGARHLYETIPGLAILTAVGIKRTLPWQPLRGKSNRTVSAVVIVLIILFARAWVLYTPRMLATYSDGYWHADRSLERIVEKSNLPPAVVFVNSSDYREVNGTGPDYYGTAFVMNDLDFEGPAIYVRDLGVVKNRAFMDRYPDRTAFIFTYPRMFDGRSGRPELMPVIPPFNN